MPVRLVLASLMTLGFLFGSLLFVVFLLALLGGAPTWTLVLIAGVNLVLTVVGWAFGPWFFDQVQGWFYKIEQMDFETFSLRYRRVADIMRGVCEREGMPLPMIRILHDDSPTAFTYGSVPSNARVAFSTGLFRFLDDDEAGAVAAHELGHIRHYDFLVMTIAALLLQLLYYGYATLRRSSADGEDNRKAMIAAAAVVYALWWIGTYVVLYLSRVREYMADRFAAEQMGDQAPLQRALVKIAYGLAELQVQADARGEKRDMRLLESTRSLGISDPKSAVGVGNAIRVSQDAAHGGQVMRAGVALSTPEPSARSVGTPSFRPDLIEPVMRFDLFNPWATVSELGSTHPLTGKRLRMLDEAAASLNRPQLFRWDAVDSQGNTIDQGRMYGDFAFEVVIWFLPMGLPVVGLMLGLLRPEFAIGLAVLGWGVGLTLRGLYSYAFLQDFEPVTMYELMCDPYASPLRGRPVQLEGEIVGKGDAGARLGEDVTMKDRSGGLVYLNFEALIPYIGNWIFGATGAAKAIGKQATATGWFRRGVSQWVDLAELKVGSVTYPSYTRFWATGGGVVLMFVGVVALWIGAMVGGNFPSDAAEAAPPVDAQGIEVW